MTLEILMTISTVVIIVCVTFLGTIAYLRRYNLISGIISVLATLLLFSGIVVLISCVDIRNENNILTALSEDWPFYVNGVEVEPENIYFGGYNIKYNKEEKKVLLYPKKDNALW